MKRPRTLMFSIKGLNNKLRRLLDSNPIECGGQLITGMQCGILGYLTFQDDSNEIFQKNIEEEFQIRRSTATGILQLMEKNSLIKREPVEYDARLKKIVLTKEGKMTREQAERRVRLIEEKLTNNLTPEEIETMFYLIDKITKDL